MTTCSTAQKPLMLFHLVQKYNITNTLVFTKSAESTSRLVKLFEFFEEARASSKETTDGLERKVVIQAYSSDLGPGERKSILDKFKTQKIDM